MSAPPASSTPPGGSTARRRRPRLLLLSPLPPPTGGIPTWTLQVLRSALGEHFDIRVVDSSPSRTGSVHGYSRFRLDRALDALRMLGRVAWALVRFRPDVAHVNTPYNWALLRDGLAVRLLGASGVRTVLHFRGGDFPESVEGLAPRWRALAKRTLRRTDRLIALTSHTRRYLETVVPPERVRYVPNFVRTEDFEPTPPTAPPAEDGRVRALFVGWLLEAKGVRELLRAAAQVPEIHLTLVGPRDTAFVESIRDELEALGERVRLLPESTRETVRGLYREAELFVLPTYREGFPNVILEAMAAGLPIVATPVGAIPDALRDGSEGLLVPPRDADALAEALRTLARDPGLRARLGASARERAESTFSQAAVLAELAEIYTDLLRESPSAAPTRPEGAAEPASPPSELPAARARER